MTLAYLLHIKKQIFQTTDKNCKHWFSISKFWNPATRISRKRNQCGTESETLQMTRWKFDYSFLRLLSLLRPAKYTLPSTCTNIQEPMCHWWNKFSQVVHSLHLLLNVKRQQRAVGSKTGKHLCLPQYWQRAPLDLLLYCIITSK